MAKMVDRYNDKISQILSNLNIKHKLTYDQVEVNRTSMVNQIKCSFAEDAYDEVIYFLRDMLMEDNPEILFVGWGGRTDESLFVEVRVR